MFDTINAAFELLGGLAIALSIIALHKSKKVSGVSPYGLAFFTVWSCWNLFYYPSLGQFWSTLGAASVALANFVWLCQMIYWSRKNG